MNPVILTADDPEPPEGSVVLDCHDHAWQRNGDHWFRGLGQKGLSYGGLKLGGSPLTLLHRGPDPEPPTTWTADDGYPLPGTVIARGRNRPIMFDGSSAEDPPTHLTSTYTVLRWGWSK